LSKKIGRFSRSGFRWNSGYISRVYENDINRGPVFWDPNLSVFVPSMFDTGIGGGKDLRYEGVVEEFFNDEAYWRPQVQHGWYYFGQIGSYMYSDGGTIELFPSSGIDVANSGMVLTLAHLPKTGIPMIARQYYRVNTEDYGVEEIYNEFAKVAYFSGRYVGGVELDTWDDVAKTITWSNVDHTIPEMMVYYDMDPLSSGETTVTATLNNDYTFPVGAIPSGVWEDLFFIGVAKGEAWEAWNLPYFPVMPSSPHVFLYDAGTIYPSGEWSVITSITDFVNSGEQVLVDHDMGVLYFGDGVHSGLVPTPGKSIGVYYTCTPGVEYEVDSTPDLTTAWDTAIELFKKGDHRNFLILSRGISDPDTITLEADLPTMSPTYGPLAVGNQYSLLTATVLDTTETPLENQAVTFFFNGDRGGTSLGNLAADTVTGTTNAKGKAYARLQSPDTVYDLGEFIDLEDMGATNQLLLRSVSPADSGVDNVFVYGIYSDDEVLGQPLPSDEALDAFFTRADVDDVPYGNIVQQRAWEELRRAGWEGLGMPVQYTGFPGGRKKLVAQWSTSALNPHTGQLGCWTALRPDSMTTVDSGIMLSFGTSLPVTDSGIEGFFVVAPALATLQAKTYNQRRNYWIYSNEIDVFVDVSEEGKGTWYLDAANALPSGVIPGSLAAASGEIPFGWRLTSLSPMFTAASALDNLTFLDINPPAVLGVSFVVDSGIVA